MVKAVDPIVAEIGKHKVKSHSENKWQTRDTHRKRMISRYDMAQITGSREDDKYIQTTCDEIIQDNGRDERALGFQES
jgi:hypothetical protein